MWRISIIICTGFFRSVGFLTLGKCQKILLKWNYFDFQCLFWLTQPASLHLQSSQSTVFTGRGLSRNQLSLCVQFLTGRECRKCYKKKYRSWFSSLQFYKTQNYQLEFSHQGLNRQPLFKKDYSIEISCLLTFPLELWLSKGARKWC